MFYLKIGNDKFLGRDVDLYFHDYYYCFKSPHNQFWYLNYLKNDYRSYDFYIPQCEEMAASVLAYDLQMLVQKYGALTVCGIPRSKRENTYHPSQMGLKRAIRKAIAFNPYLLDGMDYITRHTNTLCTHLSYNGKGGIGEKPRPGLLRDTCRLSNQIAGKNIVLIDDIYTARVGIDEDGVQALFDSGANNVILYAFGYTAGHYYKCA